MWLRVLELAVIVLSIYGIYKWTVNHLKTADTENKLEELELLEKETKIVKKAKKKYKNTKGKRNGVAKFKKQ